MRMDDGYSEGPYVAIRVFDEELNWAIDAVDAQGNYSEAVWTHWNGVVMDRETAIAHALDFASEHAPGVTDVRVIDT